MADTDDTTAVAYARSLDTLDPLGRFRSEFIIPSKTDLRRPTLAASPDEPPSSPSIYLCGNSLGLQPLRASSYITSFLRQWSTKAVTGHFVQHSDSPLAPFLHIDDHAAQLLAPLVGASSTSEVAVMGTLTANLHLAMASFYRPDQNRHKILFEGKAFPSDHYAIESQIAHHGFDPRKSMILLDPPSGSTTLFTDQICQTITENKDDIALVLLPGVQFYTGQLLDIATITAHARSHGVTIGWDLAHAVGNVELRLHHWDVDFAVWCSYKYLNCGPGAIAGLYVHERHGLVNMARPEGERYKPRLSGWWGADKETRFLMNNEFIPRPGAAGFQLSNPSALDLSAVVASLEIFNEATMPAIRAKSIAITKYLEALLEALRTGDDFDIPPFEITTPHDPQERGAQLSIRLAPKLLTSVLEHLEQNGVVVDERKPDVIRVAPAPLYNTYEDVWQFCQIFRAALKSRSEPPKDLETNGGISKSGS